MFSHIVGFNLILVSMFVPLFTKIYNFPLFSYLLLLFFLMSFSGVPVRCQVFLSRLQWPHDLSWEIHPLNLDYKKKGLRMIEIISS